MPVFVCFLLPLTYSVSFRLYLVSFLTQHIRAVFAACYASHTVPELFGSFVMSKVTIWHFHIHSYFQAPVLMSHITSSSSEGPYHPKIHNSSILILYLQRQGSGRWLDLLRSTETILKIFLPTSRFSADKETCQCLKIAQSWTGASGNTMTLISQGAGKVRVSRHYERLHQTWSLSMAPRVYRNVLFQQTERKGMAWVSPGGGWEAGSWISTIRQPTISWVWDL